MDIDPLAEEAINDIALSGDKCIMLDCTLSDYEEECKSCERLLGDECKDCVLDSSNMFTTLLAAKAKIAQDKTTGTSFDSIQALVSLEESVIHHLDEINSRKQTVRF
jgi:hypothetical protein